MMTLEEIKKGFHRHISDGGLGHPRRPMPVFTIVNKIKKKLVLTESSERSLYIYLHKTWREPNLMGRGVIEARQIHAQDCRERAGAEKKQSMEDYRNFWRCVKDASETTMVSGGRE